jgi:hypothetical protein
MSVSVPVNIALPFAAAGLKNTIPSGSQPLGAASLNDGFPVLCMTPLAAGGVPPSLQDMNGILYEISSHTVWVNSGGQYKFDATLCTAIGGYPVGAVLQSNDGLSSYVNNLAGNTTNFNTTPAAIGVSWMPYGGGAVASSHNYGADVGSLNAYQVTYAPAVASPVDGMRLYFMAAHANTGASTFAPNGLTAYPIIGGAHAALQGGEIAANSEVELVWSATLSSWVLLGCTGGATQVAPAQQSSQAITLGQASAMIAAAMSTNSSLGF